jgi:hypothetical protein
MNSAEYETFALGCYPNIAITGEYRKYFHEYKIRVTRGIGNKCGASADNILDLGSGIGYWIRPRDLAISESRFPGRLSNLAILRRRIWTTEPLVDVASSARVFHHMHDDRT